MRRYSSNSIHTKLSFLIIIMDSIACNIYKSISIDLQLFVQYKTSKEIDQS